MYNNTTHLIIGVLLVDNAIQLADISSADMLNMVSAETMSILPADTPFAGFASPMTTVYITEDGVSPSGITSDAKIVVTHSIQSAPKIDILVVPGPPPNYRATEVVKSFIKSTNDAGGHVLSVCTGILAVGASGVLDGKVGTGPIGQVPTLRKLFPKVKWNDTRRWERNAAEGAKGQVWSSGSILDGVDEAAAFVREHWAAEIAEPMMYLASVPERPVEYSKMEKEWGDKSVVLFEGADGE